MRKRSISSLLIIISILLIVAVITEIVLDDIVEPKTLFGVILFNALVSGVIASIIIEKLDARILS